MEIPLAPGHFTTPPTKVFQIS
ncbi:MAG: hypothetical protein RLZ97_647, partial [Verrucomicrobiota bacterium]